MFPDSGGAAADEAARTRACWAGPPGARGQGVFEYIYIYIYIYPVCVCVCVCVYMYTDVYDKVYLLHTYKIHVHANICLLHVWDQVEVAENLLKKKEKEQDVAGKIVAQVMCC